MGMYGQVWIGLVRLSQPITSVTPALLDFSTPLLGLLGTNVGYGRSGTGTSGMNSDAGVKRAGQNMIDARGGMVTRMGSGTLLNLNGISSTVLFQDFDHPTNLVASSMGSVTPVAQEYLIASGDSGGGLFIDVGGATKLVGVNSFLASLPYPLDTTGTNADYGDLAGVVSVQSFENWIFTVTGVPEPSVDFPSLFRSWWIGADAKKARIILVLCSTRVVERVQPVHQGVTRPSECLPLKRRLPP